MHNPMYAYSTYVHAALPYLLSHTYCLAGTLHLPLLRHNLAQIRAASSPPVPDPHIPQILGRESQSILPLAKQDCSPKPGTCCPSLVLYSFPPSPVPGAPSQPHLYPTVLLTPSHKMLLGLHLEQHLSSAACLGRGGATESWVHVLAQQEIASAKHQVPGQPCMGTRACQ